MGERERAEPSESDGQGCAQPALCTMRKEEAQRERSQLAQRMWSYPRGEAERSAGLSTTNKVYFGHFGSAKVV